MTKSSTNFRRSEQKIMAMDEIEIQNRFSENQNLDISWFLLVIWCHEIRQSSKEKSSIKNYSQTRKSFHGSKKKQINWQKNVGRAFFNNLTVDQNSYILKLAG